MFGAIGSIFGRGFIVAVIAPAALLCGVHVLAARAGLLPRELVEWWHRVGGTSETTLAIAIAATALLLHTMSYVVTRVYEGYCRTGFYSAGVALLIAAVPLDSGARFVVMSLAAVALVGGLAHLAGNYLQLRRYRLDRRAFETATDADEKKRLEHHLSRDFPGGESLVLPTRFGNIIRAAEYHPRALYYIEPITMWTRLGAVISKPYNERLDDASANTLTWLNVSVVLSIVAAESLTLAFLAATWPWAWVAAVGAAGAYAAYTLACESAHDWAEHIRGAFDLFRLDLLNQLGAGPCGSPCMTLKDERRIWIALQRLIFYGRSADDSLRVRLRSAPGPPQQPATAQEPEDQPAGGDA